MKYKEIIFAVFVELLSILLFFMKIDNIKIIVYISSHILVSILIAISLKKIFSEIDKFKNMEDDIFYISVFLIFITSVFGVIFSLFFTFYLLKKLNFENTKEIEEFGFNELSANIPVTRRNFGEGAIYNISSGSPNFKLSVLAYITKNNLPNKGTILKEALSDNNDEVRLMAFSVLSKEEDKLNKVIFEKLEELKTAPENRKEKIHKELGKLYWEFIYLGIVDDNLREFYFNLAKENFEKSKNDYESMLFLGRIYLKENRLEEAREILEKVVNVDKRAIAYLAEVYFYEKDFKKVKDLMNKLDIVSINPNFYFNYKVWSES